MKFSSPSFPFGRFVLTVFFILVAVPCSLAEESSKKEQRLIKQLEQVTEVRTKYLAKMAEADSLIGVSDTLLSSLSEQMHLASQEMRDEAQRYAEEKKTVERMLVKVSRSEANELRAGLRLISLCVSAFASRSSFYRPTTGALFIKKRQKRACGRWSDV